MAGLDGVRELVLQAEDQLLLSSKPISSFRVRVSPACGSWWCKSCAAMPLVQETSRESSPPPLAPGAGFNAAEGSAREALQRLLYCAGGAEGELLQDRTGVVLLQALSATQRWVMVVTVSTGSAAAVRPHVEHPTAAARLAPARAACGAGPAQPAPPNSTSPFRRRRFGGSAQRALHEYWGSLEAAPPTTLLLWLSLGVDDSGVKREAAQQMLRLLESKRPGTEGGGWRLQGRRLLLWLDFTSSAFEACAPGTLLKSAAPLSHPPSPLPVPAPCCVQAGAGGTTCRCCTCTSLKCWYRS